MTAATLWQAGAALWLLSLLTAFLSVDRFLGALAPQADGETDAAFARRLWRQGRLAIRRARWLSWTLATGLTLGAGDLCLNTGLSVSSLLGWVLAASVVAATFLPVVPVLLRFALRKQFPYAFAHLRSQGHK